MSDDTPRDTVEDAAFEEPIDAEFHPAEPEATRPKKGPGWFGTLSLFLLAMGGGAALGYGASEFAPGRLAPPPAPAEIDAADVPDTEPPATQAALELESEARRELAAGLRERIDTLEARVARAEDGLSEPVEPARANPGQAEDVSAEIASLKRRLAALESAGSEGDAAPEELTRSVAALASRLETVDEAISSLQAGLEALGEADSVLDRDIDRLTAETEALSMDIANLTSEIEAREAEAGSEASARAEAALALSQMDAAARRGQGFAPALASLRRLRPEAPGLADLQDFAAEGAPTLQQLSARFDDVAETVREASRPASEGRAIGLVERVFGDAVEIRREGESGVSDSLDAAKTALDNGDLGAAIAALEALDGPPAEAAAAWLEQARQRRLLERTLDGVRLDLMAEDR